MWICPNYRAENYEKGPCGCCGYYKGQALDNEIPLRRDGTDQPMGIMYPIITC